MNINNENNDGISSVKVLVVIAISLAVIVLGLAGAIFIPKMFQESDASSKDISTKKHNKVETSSDLDADEDSSKDNKNLLEKIFLDKKEEAIPSKEPALLNTDDQYTELSQVIQTMIENGIVTKDRNFLNSHNWETVSYFFQISDRMTGISHILADKITYDDENCLRYYYFKKDTLEKFAYSVLGEKLEVKNLQEVADAFGEWATQKSEYMPNGYAYVENDYLVLAVGEAGYMGPTAESFRKKYLGNGQWQIIANVVEEDYDNYYDSEILPLKWNGVITAIVEEDPDAYFDGFRIVDTSWHDAKDPEYSTDWQRAYFDIIEAAYKGELDFGTSVNKVFGFIYFNDDDIPDLVVNSWGYSVSVYCFDGKEAKQLFSGGYGAFGLNSYLYSERESVVEWSDMDYAGLEVYSNAVRFLGDARYESLYKDTPCVKYYKDKNNNGMPDEGEDNYEKPYYFLGDKEVTEQEFNEYVSAVPETTGDLVEIGIEYQTAIRKLFSDDLMQEKAEN